MPLTPSMLSFLGDLIRHPLATMSTGINGLRGATGGQLKQSAKLTAGELLSGPWVPGPMGISVPGNLAAAGTVASVGTLGIAGAAALGVGGARIGKSMIGGGLAGFKRHPLGAALSGSTGLGLLKKGTTFAVRTAKKRRKAAAKAKVAADKAKLRDQVKAARAEAKAAKAAARKPAAARTRGRAASKRRAGARRSPRKLTALQLKYFGKGHR